ncbi:protein virilizer homolog isoform X1 [Juglans microcarpa x Juglans regia]|uniref:protein virilizer homolog isoform X1 n=1 Tax=Juglans microcarpa x Juglans regia TaxID=2249226 RepID=UPI001B7EC913|nr:protein virilizer homolog isoform X1 [Juglans microcarpa x Juglans regia]
MGRPEPYVLFAQTFNHPHLDEYVDEVLFSEPVVITACEFLEQNASSAAQAVTLLGATSPPSFALEVFVKCEAETRFRRLCLPFLYSHSSSNVLEVEAVVTNHLVVRGSYRSLSLVIYGNTAEDLGQFNIEFDDNSLRNLVSSAEGKLEDLPLALHSTNLTIEEPIYSLNALSIPVAPLDISIELKQFIQLLFKILRLSTLGDAVHTVVNTLVSAASSYVTCELHDAANNAKNITRAKSTNFKELLSLIGEASGELLELYKVQQETGNGSVDLLAGCTFADFEADLVNSKELVDLYSKYFNFSSNSANFGHHDLSQKENVLLGLSVALFLCSSRESCFHFVNSGGLEHIVHIFGNDKPNSVTITLLLLGVVERATQFSIGCEGFFGWWPREDENIPSGISEGYSQLLKLLLLQKPRHDVASLATYVLHRLRFYEVASRYECAVLSVLEGLSAVGRVTRDTLNMLISAKSELKRLLKLINSHGLNEDPSPVACASRSLILGQTEGLLSYKATNSLIASSNCCFSVSDIDSHLLELIKERGFLPLSAALLSSSVLRSEVGPAMDVFVDIASSIEAIIFSLLFCRSGLIFLLNHPELSATIINALRGGDDLNKEEFLPLRYASVLISKGFFCSPREVGMIVGVHLRVVNAIDRLLTSTPHSEEFLWLLWELCGLSRSDCGRQALLALGYFPEAVSVLIEALHSVKELEPDAKISGAVPLNLAISHSAAEILEVIVTDSTALSLCSWIGHALEIHRALLSSSPGSNRKDAPTRLLELIDAGVVYHKNGAAGLLRYAAVLASGGDAHAPLTSITVLVSDLADGENAVGDSSSGFDVNAMETLGKYISEKSFDGVMLRDSSVAQLTTTFRILAFISENSTVAAAMYDEGATAVIYAVLVSCRFMLERSSNNYDYLVDEGTECNSTSDLLLERNREQSLVDLLVPSLVLLINLLQKLQEAKEQHRNAKLMNALLRLHREVSPRLAACAADLSSPYPDSALGFGAVCHLIVSALASWPVCGWTPGLFHSLLASVHAASFLALGPKETSSLLCLLNDLFPEEGIWLWKNGTPLLCAFRTLAIGTLLGPRKERQVNWYLEPGHVEKLLSQLTPQLDKLAQIIQQYAISALVVIQDMLRVLIIRIACQNAENACVLLRPIFSWTRACVSDSSSPSDMDAYKVYKFLDFLAGLMEHPCGKALCLKEGAVQMLTQVLERVFDSIDLDTKHIPDSKYSTKCGFTLISWCIPAFKFISLLCNARTPRQYPGRPNLCNFETLSAEDFLLILRYVLKFCTVLPVGKELLACLAAFGELGSCSEGRSALVAISFHIQSDIQELELGRGDERDGKDNLFSEFEWRRHPPMLSCWKKLLTSVDTKDGLSSDAIEAVDALFLSAVRFCIDGKSLNLDSVVALKFLFGLPDDMHGTDGFSEENINYIQEMITLLNSKITADDHAATSDVDTSLYRATESAKTLLLMLQKPTGSVKVDDIFSSKNVILLPNYVRGSSKIYRMADGSAEKDDDYLYLGDKFLWECPDDRSSQTAFHGKRKVSSVDSLSKRARGENSPAELVAQGAFPRGLGPSNAPSGSTRRDNFRGRKPNTSRPPSMHVDDYVARERSIDNTSNSNVIAVPRVGSTGGRPPSIHVDKFMALERERQNPMATIVGEAAALGKNVGPENGADLEKFKSKQLKTELDDELQGIDIVFDGEESESDDKLPFPQPDDNLQQPAPLIGEQSSPRSIVEETESDVNENSQFSHLSTTIASNVDENAQSEFSSLMSVSRPEMRLTREPSVSSDKKYFEQSDETKNVFPVKISGRFDSAAATGSSGFPASVYSGSSASSLQLPVESRMTPQKIYANNNPQIPFNVPGAMGSQGLYDQRFPPNQPPLPPMPPPPTILPVISQTSDVLPIQSSPFINPVMDVQQSLPGAFQVQSDYLSTFNNSSATFVSSLPMPDSKYSRTSIPSPRSARPPPPLPPTPPPYSSSPFNLGSTKTSTSPSSLYNPTSVGTSYLPPPLMPSSSFSRPASIPITLYGSTASQQLGENPPSILQSLAIPQPSIPTLHSIAQLQPLQPPQLPRPPQPPQHPRPSIQASQQLEQGVPLQNQIHMQVHPLQMLKHSQMSPINSYYQSQQQEFSHAQQQVELVQQPVLHEQGDVAIHQLQDPGMSLHEYFKSPEAIQSLLSDRDKLCQLLEQHPKLMQMLQERLGQL